MRSWTGQPYSFPYSFNQVATVFWDRYPNSFAKHVISEDVLSRQISGDTIRTRRLIVKQGASFLKKVVPTLEESIYDRKLHRLVTYTRNVSNLSLFNMDERCEYSTEDPSAPVTLVHRQMWISVNYGRLHGLLERVIELTFIKSVNRTVAGFNERLTQEFGPPPKPTPIAPGAKLKEKLRDTTKKLGFEKA